MLVCGTLFFTGSYDGEVMREKTGKGDRKTENGKGDRKRGQGTGKGDRFIFLSYTNGIE